MARKYLSTGEMAGTCPKCGKSMRACMVELHPAPQKKSS
jgi:DTW domain-containing protein YfiP